MVALNTFALVALILTGLALLVNIISLSTPNWSSGTVSGVDFNSGLWRSCTTVGILGEVCVDVGGNVADWWKGTRACMFLALFCDVGAIITLIVFMFIASVPQKIMKFVTIGLLAAAALFNVIAIAVWADKTGGNNLAWSWGIGILSLILEIVAAVLAFIAKPNDA